MHNVNGQLQTIASGDVFTYSYYPQDGSGDASSYSKVGIMMRSSLAANSPEVSILRTPTGAWYLESRTSSGGGTTTTPSGGGMTAPVYLQLVQSAGTVTGYYSYTGAAGSWTELGSVSVSLGSTIYAGLAVCAHANTTLETATFSNVSVTGTPASPSVTATAGDGYNTLTWSAVSDATSYNVYRSTTPGGEGSTPYASDITGTSMTDISVTDGTTYYYKVTAVDSAGESTPSGEVSATPSTGVVITTSGSSTAAEGGSYGLSISLSGSEVLSVGSVSVNWGDGDTQSLSVSGLSAGGGVISATHTYDSAPVTAEIQVSTSVSTPIGTQDFSSSEQSLSVTHTPPTLSISGSSTATAGSAYTLDLSGSEVGDETISQWTINWGDGSTPQVVSGNPSSASYTYANGGGYLITATATDGDGTYNASGSVSVTAGGITITPVAVQATVGQSFSGVLATIADSNTSITPDDFNWTISWGDGTSSDVGSNSSDGPDSVYVDPTTGLLTLAGSHTYAETSDSSGPYTITITLSDGTNTSTAATAATVTQLFAPSGQSLQADVGGAIMGTVATFGSVNTSSEASDYTATIQWGTSGFSVATVAADGTDGDGNPLFTVAPETYYIYAYSGNQTATVTVTDTVAGESFSFPLAVAVNQISVTPATGLAVDAGDVLSSSLGTFSTTNIDATSGEFSGEINWGDGDSSDAVITSDGTNSDGDPIFSVTPASGYVYENPGPQTATVAITDDATGMTSFISVPIASDTLYAVHIVNTTVLADQLTTNSVTYNPSVGSPDANGWVYVEADDEYDAIANAIYADVVSTNGNEYQFGEGFASSAFTLSPNSSFGTSAADLNWYLNLNNQEGSTDYTGFAKIQVAPVIEGFYVYDDNNPDDEVTPTDATTQTLDVVPDSGGNAAIDLNAILTDDSSAVREDTLWTLSVDHDSEIVASGGLSSDGSDTLIDLPSGYTQYTLKYGFDLNGDGDLSNAAETQRVVTIDITSHAAGSLSAQDLYATAGQTFTGVVATFSGDSTASASDFNASITWGDGNITAGTVVSTDGGFEVDGSHLYSSTGVDAVTVDVWPDGEEESDAVTTDANAYVRDPSLAADLNFADGYVAEDTNAPDNSGNGNDGTLVNGASYALDDNGVPGLSLNGDGQYVSVADSADLDPTTQLTVAATVNATSWSDGNTILQKGGGQYALSVEDGQLVFAVNSTDGLQEVFAPLPSTGAWHTIVGTYDAAGGQITLSIDGTVYSASASGAIVSSSGALTIGGSGDGLAADSFNGMADDVQVYGSSMSSSPILSPDAPATAYPIGRFSASPEADRNVVELTWTWNGGTSGAFYIYVTTAEFRPGSGVLVEVSETGGRFSYPVSHLNFGTDYKFWVEAASGGNFSGELGMTTDPKLSLTSGGSVAAESTYTLYLSDEVVSPTTLTEEIIKWGDGMSTTVSGNPSSVTHTYASAGTYSITATAVDQYDSRTGATYAFKADNSLSSVMISPAPTPTPTPTPPAAPTDLTLTPGNTEIALAWDASSGAASYDVYEGTSLGGETYLASVSASPTPTYIAGGLANGTTYYFYVIAENSAGPSPDSSEQHTTPIGPTPTPTSTLPTDLTLTPGNDEITLTWDAALGATSYDVYEGAESEDETQVANVSGTSDEVSGLTNDTMYFFYVVAENSSGVSAPSTERSAMPSASPIATPAAPALSVTSGYEVNYLTWNTVPGATSYNVYRSTSPGGEGSVPYGYSVSGTSLTNSTLNDGTTYYYEVTAVDDGVESAFSNEASGTPADPTPTATPTPTLANVSLTGGTLSLIGGGFPDLVNSTSPNTEVVSWTWSSSNGDPVTWDIYRSTAQGTEGASLYSGYLSETGGVYSYRDSVGSGTFSGIADPPIYYYTIVAVQDGVRSLAVQAYAPQLYFVEGYSDNASGPDVQTIYEDKYGIEVHYFARNDVYTMNSSLNVAEYNFSTIDIPAAGPVCLAGFSDGGDVMTQFADYLTSIGRDVSYLALLSPVQINWPIEDQNLSLTDLPLESSFTLYGVDAAEDWYASLNNQSVFDGPHKENEYFDSLPGEQSYEVPEGPIADGYTSVSASLGTGGWQIHGSVIADTSVQTEVAAQLQSSSLNWSLIITDTDA